MKAKVAPKLARYIASCQGKRPTPDGSEVGEAVNDLKVLIDEKK